MQADMLPEHIQPFVASLKNEFFMDEEMTAESIQWVAKSLIVNGAISSPC